MNIWKISGWELFRRFGQKSKLSGFLGAERAHPARVPLFGKLRENEYNCFLWEILGEITSVFFLLPENGKEEQHWIKMIILL